MIRWLTFVLCLLASGGPVFPKDDGSSDVRSYIPSKLLLAGQFEIKLFNNLYTQTAVFDVESNKRELGFRATYFTGITNILYGWTARINIGFDVYLRSVRIDDTGSSAFSVFKFSSGPDSRTALASVAPRIKISPFETLQTLAIQISLIVPVASDLEGQDNGKPFLDYDDIQWWAQLFYDRRLSDAFLVYVEPNLFFRFDSDRTDVLTPLKVIFNYYPLRRRTAYLPMEIAPTWDGVSWTSYYSQVGIGAKYQATPNIELETLFTIFPFGKNNGAGRTYNLGIRMIL